MASRDDDKAMDGMIRRTLAHARPEPAGCPSPDILAAYNEHSLDAEEAARCELHFSRCAHCREQLAAIIRTEEKPQVHPAPRWLLAGRWLVPAVAMMLIAFVWVARRPTQHPPAGESSNTPLVAMSKPAPNPAIERTTGGVTPSSPPSSAREVEKVAPSEAMSLSRERLSPPATRAGNASESFPRAKSDVGAPAGIVGGAAGGVTSGAEVADKLLAEESAAPQPAIDQKSAAETTEVTADAASAQIASEGKEAPAHIQTEASPSPASAPVQRAGTQMMEVVPSKKVATATAANENGSTVRGSANLVMLDQISSLSVIKTPDPAVLWRIVGEGFVERSKDSGETWEGQSPYPNAHFIAGVAPTVKICWLVGRDGTIVLTSDGKHWRKIEPPVSLDLVGIAAENALVAVVTAADGRKFTTSNGGKAWTPVQ